MDIHLLGSYNNIAIMFKEIQDRKIRRSCVTELGMNRNHSRTEAKSYQKSLHGHEHLKLVQTMENVQH
jgi:hypothetical protein